MINTSSLSKFTSSLRKLPQVIANRVAEKAAPIISQYAQDSFDSSKDPYDAPWSPAVDGSIVTLRKTGTLERFVRYVAIGTKLRVSLGVAYAKYQIGKRPVYPRQGLLPAKYSQALEELVKTESQVIMGGSNAP